MSSRAPMSPETLRMACTFLRLGNNFANCVVKFSKTRPLPSLPMGAAQNRSMTLFGSVMSYRGPHSHARINVFVKKTAVIGLVGIDGPTRLLPSVEYCPKVALVKRNPSLASGLLSVPNFVKGLTTRGSNPEMDYYNGKSLVELVS